MDGSQITYTVEIDLDGVLSAWDLKASEIIGAPSDRVSTSRLWKAITEYNNNVEPFFESLPKLQGSDELVHFVTSHFTNYGILTATGFTPPDAGEQKVKWVAKNFPIFNDKVKLVRKSAEKTQYATPTSILIDDREKCIEPWIKAGGIGILYKNVSDAIQKLEKLLID